MELKPSTDFGARDFDGKGGREIHDHFFLGANTGLAAIQGDHEAAERHARFLSRQEGPRRHLRPPRGRRDRRQARSARSGPRCRRSSRAGSTWSRSSCGPSTSAIRSARAPSTPTRSGSSWSRRSGGRVIGRSGGHRRRTARSIPTRTSSTSTCSTATATGSTAATRRTSSSRSTTSRSRRAPARSSTSRLEVPEGETGPIDARGEGQLPQVRPHLHGLRLRQGEGARAADRRDGERRGAGCRSRAASRRERALADPAGLAALERLRHRPAARGRRRRADRRAS